jgi:hypothetical protein
MGSVIILLTGHWVGDYLLQTNVIAQEKSRNLKWLLIHVALYTSVMAICAVLIFPREIWVSFVGINAALHLITDFLTSRLASKFHLNQRVYFLIIGFDQLIHSITLLGSAFVLS